MLSLGAISFNKIPWHENILSDNVNEKLLHFNNAFFLVLDNHAPIKKIKIKHRRCPFIYEEIKEKMAKRDQAHKIARETGALVDWQYCIGTVVMTLRGYFAKRRSMSRMRLKRIRVLVNSGR